jgi:hypothetical protein
LQILRFSSDTRQSLWPGRVGETPYIEVVGVVSVSMSMMNRKFARGMEYMEIVSTTQDSKGIQQQQTRTKQKTSVITNNEHY